MEPAELKRLCDENVTLPLWPVTGNALGLKRSATYEAAKRGQIAGVRVGKMFRVPSSWLRRVTGLDETPAKAA